MKQGVNGILLRMSAYLRTDIKYIVSGGFWLTTSQAVVSISAFITSVVMANALHPETLGIYKYVLSVAAILAIPTLTGMPTAMTQSVSRGFEANFSSAVRTRIKWGTLGGIASLLLASYYFFMGNSMLGLSFCIVAIFVPFMDSLNLYDSIFSGRKNFRSSSNYFSIAQIISTLSAIAAVLLSGNIFVILLAYFLPWTAIRGFYSWRVSKKENLNSNNDPDLLENGKHLSAINIINTFANQIDKIIIFQNIGASALATYAIAVAPVEQLKNMGTRILSSLAMPKYSNKENEELKMHVSYWLKRLGAVAIVATGLYIILSPFLFQILFPKYTSSIIYSQIYALSLLPSLFFLPQTALYAKMAKKELYRFNLFTSICQIGFLFAFAYLWGLMGVILARLATRFISFGLSMFYVKKL